MKVLFLATFYPPPLEGGAGVYIYNIVSNIKEAEVVLFANSRPDCTAFDAQQNYRTIRNDNDQVEFTKLETVKLLWQWLRSLIKLLRDEKFDAIHAGGLFFSGSVANLLGSLFGTPYVVYVYGEEITVHVKRDDPVFGPLRRWLYRRVLRQANGIISVSEFTSELVRRFGVNPDKIVKVVPMVAASKLSVSCERLEAAKERLGLKTNDQVVLCVGRLTERKNQRSIVRAMPPLLRDVPQARLVLAGRGPEEENLKKLVAQLGVSDNVTFAGYVNEMDLAALYELCEVFVMPHVEMPSGDTEGCPTVFLEASGHGKPVVGGMAGGVKDAIIDGETGFIIDGEDEKAIARVVTELLRDKTLAHEMGQAGKRRVLGELTPESGAAKVLEQTRTFINESAPR